MGWGRGGAYSPAQRPVPASAQKAISYQVRDEANALTALAFRNGFLEDLHAGKPSPLLDQPGYSRISNAEMKRLMIETSAKLARMLALKQQKPAEYDLLIRDCKQNYCRTWQRD